MKLGSTSNKHTFLCTELHTELLSDMVMDHSLSMDLCLIGQKGCGKSAVAMKFAHLTGYDTQVEVMQLFKDMSARDLLQSRSTDADGNTEWNNTPLVRAAIQGYS